MSPTAGVQPLLRSTMQNPSVGCCLFRQRQATHTWAGRTLTTASLRTASRCALPINASGTSLWLRLLPKALRMRRAMRVAGAAATCLLLLAPPV